MRYCAVTAYSTPGYITVHSLLNTVLAYYNIASASAIGIMSSVRLRRVRMYYASSSSGSLGTDAAEIELTWLGQRGPEVKWTARGIPARPACIDSEPPEGSYADMWWNSQDSIDQILFNFMIPQYGVMDITYDFTLAEGDNGGLIVNVTNPAVTGIVYGALDNATTSASLYNLYLRPDASFYAAITDPSGPMQKAAKRREELREQMLDDYISHDIDAHEVVKDSKKLLLTRCPPPK